MDRRDEEAVGWLARSVETQPNIPMSHFLLAAASVRLGRSDEAREALKAGLELNPSFTVSRYRSAPLSANPAYLAARGQICDDLQKLGLPES
jgi:hypothetical protein